MCQRKEHSWKIQGHLYIIDTHYRFVSDTNGQSVFCLFVCFLFSHSNQDNDKDDELTERLTGETNGDGTPDTSPDIKDHSPTDAYKRAAPQLLNELAGLLSQNKWIVERYIPHGIVNILNYSWQDLTAGAKHSKGPDQTYKDQSRGSAQLDDTIYQLSAIDKKETERTNPCVVGNSERKPQVSSNARMKKRKQNSKIGK